MRVEKPWIGSGKLNRGTKGRLHAGRATLKPAFRLANLSTRLPLQSIDCRSLGDRADGRCEPQKVPASQENQQTDRIPRQIARTRLRQTIQKRTQRQVDRLIRSSAFANHHDRGQKARASIIAPAAGAGWIEHFRAQALACRRAKRMPIARRQIAPVEHGFQGVPWAIGDGAHDDWPIIEPGFAQDWSRRILRGEWLTTGDRRLIDQSAGFGRVEIPAHGRRAPKMRVQGAVNQAARIAMAREKDSRRAFGAAPRLSAWARIEIFAVSPARKRRHRQSPADPRRSIGLSVAGRCDYARPRGAFGVCASTRARRLPPLPSPPASAPGHRQFGRHRFNDHRFRLSFSRPAFWPRF